MVNRVRLSGRVRLAVLVAVFAASTTTACTDSAERSTPTTETATVTTTPQPPAQPVRAGSFANLIPRPTRFTAGAGRFVLVPATTIVVTPGSGAAGPAALLRDELTPLVGSSLALTGPGGENPDVGASGGGVSIAFERSTDEGLGREGYELRVRPERVTVEARTTTGFGWAVQTLLQALPPAPAAGDERPARSVALPAGNLRDVPHYGWRGAMLDVARHWFGPDDIEAVIDLVALYKMSILHLHLSDDQGWRIQIRAYPELTEVGAATEVGGGAGGFLTQDDYRRIVAYAARRGVTVVPEVDMPGHTNAALTSLPWLNCDGQAPPPYTGTHVGFSSLCTDKPETAKFVDTVVGELAAMTPGPYLHIGGDESKATDPAAYRRFVTDTADVVRRHGKVPVGWEEVGHADIGSNAVAQHWLDPGPAKAAAAQGAGVVLSPAKVAYIDMKLDPGMDVGNSWAGMIDSRRAYEWDPATFVSGLDPDRVLGVEAPLWSETFSTKAGLGRLLLPRLAGYAELGWSGGPSKGGFDEYRTRLATQADRWRNAGWTFTADPSVPWPD